VTQNIYSVEYRGDKRIVSWIGCVRKQSWPNFNALSRHSLQELRNTVNFDQCPIRMSVYGLFSLLSDTME
jgi:hypothetical protein